MLKNPIIGIAPDKKLSRQITMDDKKDNADYRG